MFDSLRVVGYRGKVAEQNQARDLRATGMTLVQIATELDVAKSSVSLWVRDVEFEPKPRQRAQVRGTHPLHLRKLAEIEDANTWGRDQIGALSDDAFLVAGVALYAGEGAKRDGAVCFANTDPEMVRFFCSWLRHYFEVDEARITGRVYLHEGLDLCAAERSWSDVAGIPRSQFRKAYRAVADSTIRLNKHEYGCFYVRYCCTKTHRRIMGLIRALLSSDAIPG